MPKNKKQLDSFTELTWDDLEEWAGGKIISRGKSYQRQGRVSDLAVTDDGSLLAWVKGSERYATKVEIDSDGVPYSICSCPYEFDCKHGVAIVLEYLARIEKKQRVPKANDGDERFILLADEDWDDEDEIGDNFLSPNIKDEIDEFLKNKTKNQLIDLIITLAEQYPEMAQDILDRKLLNSGSEKAIVARVRREIRDIEDQPGWQNYWSGEGFTPDYSAIRNKLATLLEMGHADDVLALGKELITSGSRQVEQSDDHGETHMEVADCMPLIVKALAQSSLALEDKLSWAMDAVLQDQYEVCGVFAEYLHRKHTLAAWSVQADRLLGQLKAMKLHKGEDFNRYERDRLSDWAVHALKQGDRTEEIIPLCEIEAKKTGSYGRLVKLLVEEQRYEEAERWIHEGVRATGEKWPGIASNLRDHLRDIRARQKDWPAVAAHQVYEFIDRSSQPAYSDCKKASEKTKVWPCVRERLLAFLETGSLPWQQKGWPLPATGFDDPKLRNRNSFPRFDTLIDIAIYEKQPAQVLNWYDRRPKQRFGWYGADEDKVATAVQKHAPERAVEMWQKKAEGLIGQVKPSAYQEAVKYLRKAAKIMIGREKQAEWNRYIQDLREEHVRKRRLMEILDGLDGRPIVKKSL